jgi:hypothetical protein
MSIDFSDFRERADAVSQCSAGFSPQGGRGAGPGRLYGGP